MICPCRRRTIRLFATLRVRPVAVRDEPYARFSSYVIGAIQQSAGRHASLWQSPDDSTRQPCAATVAESLHPFRLGAIESERALESGALPDSPT